MVIMSDGQAFGLKFGIILLTVCLIAVLFAKLDKNSDCTPNPEYQISPEPTVVIDTLFVKDTVYIARIKHDTVYVTNRSDNENFDSI